MEVSRGIRGFALLLEVAHDKGKDSTHLCGWKKELRMEKMKVFKSVSLWSLVLDLKRGYYCEVAQVYSISQHEVYEV